MPLSVAISVAVHAAAAIGLAPRLVPARARAGTPPPAPPIEIVTVAPPPPPAVEPPPLDVVFLPDPVEPAGEPPRPARSTPTAIAVQPPAAARGAAASDVGSDLTITDSAGEAASPDGSTTRTPLMTMRGAARPRLGLPAGRWDDLDHVPKGTRPERSARTGLLSEAGGGTYRSEQDVFTATVQPDGSVDFKDTNNLRFGVAIPKPADVGRKLATWYESDKGPSGKQGDTSLGDDIQARAGSEIDPEEQVVYVIIPVLRGRFDVTDWLMRSKGIDPYSSRKLKFLATTLKERVQIGERHRADQLARAAELIHRALKALEASPLDTRERKQALFELWDDCVETGDEATIRASLSARAMVIGFIRKHFPAGSADAYTADELAAIARAQQSKTPFQPYN